MSNRDQIYWSSWESLNANHAKVLAAQLKREVDRQRRLFDVIDTLEVLATDGESDNILESEPRNRNSAFIVHLIWSDVPVADDRLP